MIPRLDFEIDGPIVFWIKTWIKKEMLCPFEVYKLLSYCKTLHEFTVDELESLMI